MLVTILSGTFQTTPGPAYTNYSTAGYAKHFVVLRNPDQHTHTRAQLASLLDLGSHDQG